METELYVEISSYPPKIGVQKQSISMKILNCGPLNRGGMHDIELKLIEIMKR